MKGSNKGITLIALIITIIVLLILAGITIGALTSNNSVLKQAGSAKNETKGAEEAEKVQLAIHDATISVSQTVSGELTTEAVNKGLKGQFGEDAEAQGDGPWTYTGEYNTYIIEKNGELADLQSLHITNYNELLDFANRVNAGEAFEKYIVYLDNDITMEDEDWVVIGTSGTHDEGPNTFYGIFEGNNHTIKGLKINTYNKFSGLFSVNNGVIKNLKVESSYNLTGGISLGSIVGVNWNDIINCHVITETKLNSGDNFQSRYQAGGISGTNNGTISKCTVKGKLEGAGKYVQVGGIAGNNSKDIINCTNEAKISSIYTYDAENCIGGISGENLGNVKRCINKGGLEVSNSKAGGIVGNNSSSGIIDECSNKADFGSNYEDNNLKAPYIGGICGKNFNATIRNCYNIGNGVLMNSNCHYMNLAGILADSQGERKY